MKQLTLATVGFECYAKTTRRAAFLAGCDNGTGVIRFGSRAIPIKAAASSIAGDVISKQCKTGGNTRAQGLEVRD
jgi:hypothetical protein